MDTYMDIEDIEAAYWNGDYNVKMKIPERVSPQHIFDENLSVKRNREMVLEHNEMVEKMQKEKWNKSNEFRYKLKNDIVVYIVQTYNINEDQACVIEEYVYDKYHSFMSDYFFFIDEIAEMVEEVLRTLK